MGLIYFIEENSSYAKIMSRREVSKISGKPKSFCCVHKNGHANAREVAEHIAWLLNHEDIIKQLDRIELKIAPEGGE